MLWRVRWTFVSWANSFVGTQSCATPPGRSAGRPYPTRSWYVRVLDSTGDNCEFHLYLGRILPNMLCMKSIYERTIKCWTVGQQPRTKSARGPAGQPDVLFLHRFPDMPCMKKGLQRQKGVGPLVGSQGRRAAVVLVINRL